MFISNSHCATITDHTVRARKLALYTTQAVIEQLESMSLKGSARCVMDGLKDWDIFSDYERWTWTASVMTCGTK